MYHTITKVEHLSGYRLLLTFDDGAIREVDLISRIMGRGGLAKELLDEGYFGQVRLSGESIEWPNGYDICPNLLYEIGTDIAKIA
jgi:hypothetical protein